MNQYELTKRERQVFLAIVHGFIHNAEPVGSRYISRNYGLNISPATVRNVMADLEEKGLIWQPHTSAGRMPTTNGYRTYVDNLEKGAQLSDEEQHIIIEKLQAFSKDFDLIVSKTATVLGEISSQLGVVLSPRFTKGVFSKLELLRISEQKLLLVISITSGLVKTIIIEIDNEFSADFISETTGVINERLYGLSIEQLTESFDERFNDLDARSRELINAIKEKSDKLFGIEPTGEFFISGARNVIANPEFDSKEQVGRILELLDRKDILVRVLTESHGDGVSIVIGEENSEELMRNCSVITTTYSIDGAEGTLGVIGPTRMQYAKIISLVKFMSDTLNYIVSKTN